MVFDSRAPRWTHNLGENGFALEEIWLMPRRRQTARDSDKTGLSMNGSMGMWNEHGSII